MMIGGTYVIIIMLAIPVLSGISFFFRYFREISIAMALATLLFTTLVFTHNSGT